MSVIDLSSVITSLASHVSLPVKRPAAGSFVAGRYVEVAPVALTVLASVQPLTGEDLEVLPEAERTSDAIEIFSIAELFPVNHTLNKLGDLVTYRGRDYRVRNVEQWDVNGNYFRSVATRVGQ